MTDTNSTKTTPKTEPKAQLVERLLKSRNGASLAELVGATGWQPHTCRAFLAGLRKKGKMPVRDKRKDGTTFYKLAPPPKATDAKVESEPAAEAKGGLAAKAASEPSTGSKVEPAAEGAA